MLSATYSFLSVDDDDDETWNLLPDRDEAPVRSNLYETPPRQGVDVSINNDVERIPVYLEGDTLEQELAQGSRLRAGHHPEQSYAAAEATDAADKIWAEQRGPTAIYEEGDALAQALAEGRRLMSPAGSDAAEQPADDKTVDIYDADAVGQMLAQARAAPPAGAAAAAAASVLPESPTTAVSCSADDQPEPAGDAQSANGTSRARRRRQVWFFFWFCLLVRCSLLLLLLLLLLNAHI